MIDNIKISTKIFDHEKLLNDPAFNFASKVNTSTSEILLNEHGNYKEEAFFQGLKIFIYHNNDETLVLSIVGSIHKFFNNGVHNYNDFKLSDIVITIERLSKLFYFEADKCSLSNLEIGVNIIPTVKTSKILRGLFSHKNKEFKSISMDNAEYYQVRHTNYYIKCYNKAKQYKAKGFQIDGDLLRYELKYRKMSDLIKILTKKQIIDRDYMVLSDLKNINVLHAFSELLISKWNEILFFDYSISKKNLTDFQKRKLLDWRNKDYWIKLDKQSRFKQKKGLKDVTLNHSMNLQKEIGVLINNKIQVLLPKGLPFNRFDIVKKDDHLTTSINVALLNKGLPFNTIYKVEIGNLKTSLKQLPKRSNKTYRPNLKIKLLPGEEIIPNYYDFQNDKREIPF